MSEIVLNDPGTLSTGDSKRMLFPLGNDKQNGNFELGVSMIIHFWPTLKTAVDNQWGGANSAEKRDWITGIIIEEFEKNWQIDIIYIHELLTGIMEDEFDTIIEDGSTINVGEKIVKVYNECLDSRFDNIKKLYNKWLEREQTIQKDIVTVSEDPLNPDSDEDEEREENDDDDDDDQMDVDTEEHKPTRVKQEPIVDDDGFTVVTKRR